MRVVECFKNLSLYSKVIVSAITLTLLSIIIFVAMSITLVLLEPHKNLNDFTETKMKSFLEKKTLVDIVDVAINKPAGSVSVFYFDDNAFDENAVIYILTRDAVEIMPLLFNMTGVKKVKVTEMGSYLDDEGSVSVEVSAAITLTEKKAEDIAWDEMGSDNRTELISSSSEFYVHPAVRAEINDESILEAIVTQLSTN